MTQQQSANPIEDLAKQAESRFRPLKLPSQLPCAATAGAQGRLDAALTSVNNVLLTMDLARSLDKALKQRDIRGRLTETLVDLLRAAIAFAGAGLDASLKQLIKDTIRDLSKKNDLARKKFTTFVEEHLAPADASVNGRKLAEVLTSPGGIQEELLNRYERDLTGESLQSAQQVGNVCGALGVDDRKLRERLKEGALLDGMFRARNQIVHELDLTEAGRRPRKLDDARRYAEEALSVAQEIINAVTAQLIPKPAV